MAYKVTFSCAEVVSDFSGKDAPCGKVLVVTKDPNQMGREGQPAVVNGTYGDRVVIFVGEWTGWSGDADKYRFRHLRPGEKFVVEG